MSRWRRWAALVLTAGCAGGAQVDPTSVPPADSTRTFVVFRGEEATTIDHLQVVGGSLTGQRVPEYPNGPRPVVDYPMSTVDSVTEAHLDRRGLTFFAIPIAVMVAVIVMLRASWGGD